MNKKLTLKDIEKILFNRIKNDRFRTLKSFPEPSIFKDMNKAVKRIVKAIKEGETINIVGDYDVDGIVSTALCVEFFSKLGAEINYIIPNRFEHGYGLSPIILDQIYEGLIITVDNGISAFEAAQICKDRGQDLIITDHHTVGETIPEAYAVINPKQNDCQFPFKDICGAQVAWYLCAALKKELDIQYNLMELFDILALAIVADIMPMVSMNQTTVKYGLKALENSNRPAIAALKQRYNLQKINEDDIGFKFAPLINCAGRMSDPIIALEFLLSLDQYEADSKLDFLIELNEQRKQDQLRMFNEAKAQVDPSCEVIVVSSDHWNEGIIGIVASKLCEKYKKPSFVFSIKGQIAKASSRSTSNIDLYSLIYSCKDLLDSFGGHKQAAGLSLQASNLQKFTKTVNLNINNMANCNNVQDINTLGEFCINDVNGYSYNLIENYRPFGQTNPYPVFTFLDMKVLAVSKMGRNKEFSKLTVSNGKTTAEVVVFVDFEGVNANDMINFTASITKNEFRGEVNYNLLFKELL